MKKLPKLYKNDNINITSHNKKMCYVNNNNIDSIEDSLNTIFNGLGHPYNIKVLLKTKDNLLETFLISRNKTSITTIDNEIIKLTDIIYLQIKN